MGVKLKFVEVLMLSVLLLIVVGLFAIPTITFFVLSTREISSSQRSTSCAETEVYAGEICRDELEELFTCFIGSPAPPELQVPSTLNQQQNEVELARLFRGLNFVRPTVICEESIRTFLCLKTFGLCANGQSFDIDRESCVEIRDTICPAEWILAIQFIGEDNLPICEDLQARQQCADNGSIIATLLTEDTPVDRDSINSNVNNSNPDSICAEDFFFDVDVTHTCRPICGEFFSRNVTWQRTLISFGYVLSLLILLIVIPVQRETMLKFPLTILLYTSISSLVLTSFLIIGFFDNAKLYCGNRDFIYSTAQGNETAFCTVSGLVFSYVAIQLPYWIFANSVVIFWSLAFPFNYRNLKVSGRLCYLHITIVVTALFLPVPLALVHLKDGFIGLEYPTTVCVGRNTDFNYYFVILPQSLLIGGTTLLLVMIFWLIFKNLVLRQSKAHVTAAKAELKIALILVYYLVAGIVGMVGTTYIINNRDQIEQEVQDFFICSQQGGLLANCRQFLSGRISSFNTFTDITLLMLAFLPVVLLFFGMNFQVCREKLNIMMRSSEAKKVSKEMHLKDKKVNNNTKEP